ncbi:thiopeptide-type bacteriocin biosynthesis protein [Spiractinospora alimapuensis]|uniref:thiopeptide-type bacteriocin biosynthesis protein n=1 Tax=Spiractinospora alimapuensis TaxID=2820884 RepID=UPI001F2C37B1|nr:thiopeptide-type bacteriocin biosynthesis protein [Spiractinospora alimapuensis]QVQ51271.1 thiopeptide-type bacteriocin biosynthesis protein [Spiractinospora alimapuensis]
MAESDWISVHVFRHDDLEGLVSEGIAPLMGELRAENALRDWFFLRYWEGGPHVRLRVLPEDGRRGAVEELLRNRLETYLRDNPSRGRMRLDHYLHLAASYSRRERKSSFATELRPDNSLVCLPYSREHDRYGRNSAIEAVERHFTESSELASQLLRPGTTSEQRTTSAYAAILLAWLACEPDLPSLAERIGTASPTVPASVDLLGLGGSPRRGGRGATGEATEIARSLRTLASHVDQVRRSGTFVDWSRSVTALRDALERCPSEDRPAIEVFQVLDTCAHLFCNRIGVLLNAEDVVRGMAADAVRELASEEAPEGNENGEDTGVVAQSARRVLRQG